MMNILQNLFPSYFLSNFETKGIFDSKLDRFIFKDFGNSPHSVRFSGVLPLLSENIHIAHSHVGHLYPEPSAIDFQAAKKINRVFRVVNSEPLIFVMTDIVNVQKRVMLRVNQKMSFNCFLCLCHVHYYDDEKVLKKETKVITFIKE